MRKRATSVGLVTVLVGLLCVVAPTDSAAAVSASAPARPRRDRGRGEPFGANIIGNPARPTSTRWPANANFTRPSRVTHPSQPNYLALFSGSTQGVTDDTLPAPFTTPNLGDQLIGAGRTFAGYSESPAGAGLHRLHSGQYRASTTRGSTSPRVPASGQPAVHRLPDRLPRRCRTCRSWSPTSRTTCTTARSPRATPGCGPPRRVRPVGEDAQQPVRPHVGRGRQRPATASRRSSPASGSAGQYSEHDRPLQRAAHGGGHLRFRAAWRTARPRARSSTCGPPARATRHPPRRFPNSCSQLNCSFDASASSDPDGTLQRVHMGFRPLH